jgi:hypothetical protein
LVVAYRWVQVTNAYLFSRLDRWTTLPSDTGRRQPLESLGLKEAVDKQHAVPDGTLATVEHQALTLEWGLA